MSYSKIGDGIAWAFVIMAAMLVIFVPLGIWKVVELISDLLSHIQWV